MNAEPWVTASEVAPHTGVAKDTDDRWRERKDFPAHKISRRRKFPLPEVGESAGAGGVGKNRIPVRQEQKGEQF
ncbi:MAG: DNA-binding protein [Simplicispira sp.]|nr:DNA-binding protein [Simplicispira sp.]